MNKKKLSHSNLNSSITSVLAALLCIVIGMAVGFLVLLAINPAQDRKSTRLNSSHSK